MPSPIYEVFKLSPAQIRRLIKKHGHKLSGTITQDKGAVYIVIRESVADPVEVQDILGNSLGNITVKEAWAL